MLVDEVRGALEAALGERRPVILTAPTGSGKSTRVPLWLRELGEGQVLVVQPRRVACRSLATWLAEQAGEPVGRGIGYRVRFDDKSGPDTRVLFVTPGVALRMLREPSKLPFSAVMLDELHERGWQVDLALALLMRRLAGGERLHLVLTSATLEAEALAASLGAVHVESRGRQFPVEVSYDAEPAAPSTRDLEERVAAAVLAALGEGGDVLVFLPGKGEIERCRRELAGRGLPTEVQLVTVHGGVPPKTLAAAFAPGRGRRVYLATNVAETSLTLPGVRSVVDAGLLRQPVHRAGRSVLALVPASRASLDQRAGRAGRVAAGRCRRLFSRGFAPDESTPAEVTRVELDDLVLEAAAAGLSAAELEGAPLPTPLPPFALARARERLRVRGALDDDGRLTERGRRLAEIPLAAADAAVLVEPPPAIASTIADLSSLLDLEQDLLVPLERLPPAQREEAEEARAELLAGAAHEVEVLLRCLRRGDARRHGLHAPALDGARRRASAFRAFLRLPVREPRGDEERFPPWDDVALHLLRRLPEAGFVLRPRALHGKGRPRDDGREPWANGSIEVEVRRFVPVGDGEPPRPRAGVLLQHSWLEGRRGRAPVGRGWMLLPCAPAVLAQAGLGERRVVEAQVRGRGRALLARVERVLAGVVLEERDEELEGPVLHAEAARLIAEGRLLKGAREPVEDALHLWRLLAAWPADDDVPRGTEGPAAPAATDAWVQERLAVLGVERAADLGLVDAADLVPDLRALFGTDEPTLARLLTDFPREWEYQGARYAVVVDPVRRRVTLEPEGARARKAKDPPAAMLPRFRGFSVRHRQASRVVTLR